MLAIGRALTAQPKLVLLDEPSMGPAPKLVDQIFSVIADFSGDELRNDPRVHAAYLGI